MRSKPFDMNRIDSRLSRLYTGCDNHQETYDRWADRYNDDLVGEMGYVAHIEAAGIFHQVVPSPGGRVLDVACGTGLAGLELQAYGYDAIDGTDFSPAMLEKAQATGCYRSVFRHDFSQDTPTIGSYDALICVGLFSFVTPPITNLVHVIRCLKADGLAVVTVNGAAWDQLDHERTVRQEASRHGFVIEAIHTVDYLPKQGIDGRVLVIRASEKPR